MNTAQAVHMPVSQYCSPLAPLLSLQLRTVSLALQTQFPPSGGLQLGVVVVLQPHRIRKSPSLTASY